MTKNKCLICHTETTKTTTLSNGKIFHHCDNCAFSHLDSKFFLNQEEEKARYDLHENSINNQGYVEMFENFIEFGITPYQDSVKKILDYGSGPEPVLAELLKNHGYQVEVYDPFYAAHTYEAESFDLISSTEVFEHFFDPLKEIQNILKLLKSNGYLVIMTRFSPELEEFKSWFYKDDPSHVSFYQIKTFTYISQLFDLEILKNDGFQTICIHKR